MNIEKGRLETSFSQLCTLAVLIREQGKFTKDPCIYGCLTYRGEFTEVRGTIPPVGKWMHWNANKEYKTIENIYFIGNLKAFLCWYKRLPNIPAYSSFSLSHNIHGTKKYIWNRPVEEAKKMKCYKRLIYNIYNISQVFVAHSFWVSCRNISHTFVELCMETPYWWTETVHQYGRRKSTKTSGVHFFYKSSSFSLEN